MQSECISYIPVGLGASEEPENSRQRRRWEKDPPERLLSALEKAGISRAFSTFLIHRGGLISKCIIIRSYFAAAHNKRTCAVDYITALFGVVVPIIS